MLTEHDVAMARSTYYAHRADPVSEADWGDAHRANAALDTWRANRSLYGADKLATAMRKAGHDVGRDQVARLMRIVGIEGVRRGKHKTITTRRDPDAARHPDLIRRRWRMPTRPDQWWVADTYVWTLEGFVYTSFVTDVCSRWILGWRVSSSKATPAGVLSDGLCKRYPPFLNRAGSGLREKEDIPVATTKVNDSGAAVESAGRGEPVLSPEALDELMAKVDANGLGLLGPDGVLAGSRRR